MSTSESITAAAIAPQPFTKLSTKEMTLVYGKRLFQVLVNTIKVGIKKLQGIRMSKHVFLVLLFLIILGYQQYKIQPYLNIQENHEKRIKEEEQETKEQLIQNEKFVAIISSINNIIKNIEEREQETFEEQLRRKYSGYCYKFYDWSQKEENKIECKDIKLDDIWEVYYWYNNNAWMCFNHYWKRLFQCENDFWLYLVDKQLTWHGQ